MARKPPMKHCVFITYSKKTGLAVHVGVDTLVAVKRMMKRKGDPDTSHGILQTIVTEEYALELAEKTRKALGLM